MCKCNCCCRQADAIDPSNFFQFTDKVLEIIIRQRAKSPRDIVPGHYFVLSFYENTVYPEVIKITGPAARVWEGKATDNYFYPVVEHKVFAGHYKAEALWDHQRLFVIPITENQVDGMLGLPKHMWESKIDTIKKLAEYDQRLSPIELNTMFDKLQYELNRAKNCCCHCTCSQQETKTKRPSWWTWGS